jgi:hypothetical protein
MRDILSPPTSWIRLHKVSSLRFSAPTLFDVFQFVFACISYDSYLNSSRLRMLVSPNESITSFMSRASVVSPRLPLTLT